MRVRRGSYFRFVANKYTNSIKSSEHSGDLFDNVSLRFRYDFAMVSIGHFSSVSLSFLPSIFIRIIVLATESKFYLKIPERSTLSIEIVVDKG